MRRMLLGIDFGTTRTVVAAAVDGRYPVVAFDVGGEYREYLPGIAVEHGGELWFGWEAAARLREQPDAALRSIKRVVSELAPDEYVPGLSGEITALDLAAGFLRYTRRTLAECSNLEFADEAQEQPIEVAVAVPANASTRQRYLTLEAFARAGFRVVRMLNEPTAAAIEFAHRNRAVLSPRSPKRYVIVYDLGGGTFDVSAISLEGRTFELIASEGLSALGGDDFDEVVLASALEAAGVDPKSVPDATRVSLLERCREAKEALRPSSRKLLIEWEPDFAEPVVLDTAAIYTRCQPLVDRTVALVDRLFASLAARGVAPAAEPGSARELGGLYLVGGATAFPAVARTLRNQWRRKLQLAQQPHAATAVGLAVSADPGADVLVREATTRHFGVWREGDGGREKVFDPILSKDTLPAGDALVVSRAYHPSHTVGHLRFLECTALTADGQPAGDVTPWPEVVFPYEAALATRADVAQLPAERTQPRTDEISEIYTYQRDGRVQLAIENRTGGYRRSYLLGTLR